MRLLATAICIPLSLLAMASAGPVLSTQPQATTVQTPAASSTAVPHASSPSPLQTVPQPIMRNPNLPRRVVHNPKPGPGGSGQREQFTALVFSVKTGDDDLRLDSAAWIDFSFQDHTSVQCLLKEQLRDGWNNNSTHDEDIPVCALPAPETFDQIKAAKVELAYHIDDRDFETPDNWNVDRVRIDAVNTIDHSQTCVFDESGNPLVRMKDVVTAPESNSRWPNSTFDLGNHPSTC